MKDIPDDLPDEAIRAVLPGLILVRNELNEQITRYKTMLAMRSLAAFEEPPAAPPFQEPKKWSGWENFPTPEARHAEGQRRAAVARARKAAAAQQGRQPHYRRGWRVNGEGASE